jgi:hypothetical protein
MFVENCEEQMSRITDLLLPLGSKEGMERGTALRLHAS